MRGVESALAVHVRLVDVDARPVDRLGNGQPVRDGVHDRLQNRAA